MTQSELWIAKWQEAVDFLETYRRKPSKFIPEERNLRSWWKHNKMLMNAGELKPWWRMMVLAAEGKEVMLFNRVLLL